MKGFIASALLAVSACFVLPGTAVAFSLVDLGRQLSEPAVVRGPFVQEKHLRALPQPLTSQGTFVLARGHGLLWRLQTPLQQDYRITAQGIARRAPDGWQALPARAAGSQQNQLMFAVLEGETSALQRDFNLALEGDAGHWQLRLTPKALLLQQVFDRIELSGGRYVERIELFETQGDSTRLNLPASVGAATLNDQERSDFAR